MFRCSSLEKLFPALRPRRTGGFRRSVTGEPSGVVRRRLSPVLSAAVLGTCAAGWLPGAGVSTAFAAAKDVEWTQWEDETPESGSASSSKSDQKIVQAAAEETEQSSQFMGAIGRGGHLAGPTFGREESISPIEFMPFLMLDDHFFFADARGFLSNRAQGGGNLGVGYRYLDQPAHAWYGGSFWYDIDNISGYHFQDIGISLEAMVDRWEFRGNFYTPVGPQQKDLGSFNSNARFAGNQLLFDATTRTGTAMRGFDVEAGYSLPVDLRGVNDQLRGFVGYYHFTGPSVEDIHGVKARVELEMTSTVTTQLQFTHDDTFGSNLMVGAQLNLPFGRDNPASEWRGDTPNPFRYVERNYNVIVDRTTTFEEGVIARDANGNAYVVGHVDSTAGAGGAGTPTNPFATVADAQVGVAGVNLLFVHSDSVLNEQIVLGNGQQLIGEGTGASVLVQGFGTLALPTLNAGATPVIQGGAGPAVTLGSGSRVSGFTIDNVTGVGILGNGINGATVENVDFTNITGDGIAFTNATGLINLQGLTFDTIGGNGLSITGGNAIVNVSATFDNVTGDGISVQNTTGGSVRLTDVNIENATGRGLFLNNLLGDFFSNGLGIDNVGGNGVEIVGGTGNLEFAGTTTITDPTGSAFVVDNTAADVMVNNLSVTTTSAQDAVVVDQATGEVTFTRLAVDADGSRGLVVTDSDDVTIGGGTISTENFAAADIEDSTIDIRLQSVFVDGGTVGIRVVDTAGTFFVVGTNGAGSGGTIQNTTTAAIVQNSGTIAFQRMLFDNNVNGVVSSGSELISLSGVQFTDTTNFAFDSLNDELVSVANSTFTNNGTTGTMRLRADVAGTYQAQIVGNLITDTNGTAITYSNSAAAIGSGLTLTAQNNIINVDANNSSALAVLWNGPLGLSMIGNQLNLTGNQQNGLDLQALSPTHQLAATVSSNAVIMSGNSSFGFRTLATDTSSLLFSQNGVTMNGNMGTGFWFSFGDATDAFIHTNGVVDNGGAGTGIEFASVAAASRLQIDNNQLNFASNSAAVDRGIVFGTVFPTLQLFGTTSNTILGATNNIILPAVGTAQGSIIINNTTINAP